MVVAFFGHLCCGVLVPTGVSRHSGLTAYALSTQFYLGSVRIQTQSGGLCAAVFKRGEPCCLGLKSISINPAISNHYPTHKENKHFY